MSFVRAQTTPLMLLWLMRVAMLVIEVGGTFDHSLKEASLTKLVQYQQLKSTVSQVDYKCQLFYFYIW